jgi:hypothetical protein
LNCYKVEVLISPWLERKAVDMEEGEYKQWKEYLSHIEGNKKEILRRSVSRITATGCFLENWFQGPTTVWSGLAVADFRSQSHRCGV